MKDVCFVFSQETVSGYFDYIFFLDSLDELCENLIGFREFDESYIKIRIIKN